MRDLEAAYQRISHWVDFGPGDCITSRYSCGSHGYAQAWDGETVVLTHRIVWEWHHGPIPAGLTVDHRCHTKKCVNIEHLRLLANRDNATDNGQVRINPDADSVCREGHTMTRGGSGANYCRTCQNRRRRERRANGKAN